MNSTLYRQDGTVAVDPLKYPALYRTISRARERDREKWRCVVALRAEGKEGAADRLLRKILGTQGPPMSDEKKAALAAYKEAHKDEIKLRLKQKRETRQRTLALLTTGRRRKGTV